IAQAMEAALGHLQPLAELHQVAQLLIGIRVIHQGADGHRHRHVLAAPSGHVPALAFLAVLGLIGAGVAEVRQGVQALGRFQEDAAAIPAVAAVRAAHGDELLAAEADDAVAAVTGDHFDGGFVYELHGFSLVLAETKRPRKTGAFLTHLYQRLTWSERPRRRSRSRNGAPACPSLRT